MLTLQDNFILIENSVNHMRKSFSSKIIKSDCNLSCLSIFQQDNDMTLSSEENIQVSLTDSLSNIKMLDVSMQANVNQGFSTDDDIITDKVHSCSSIFHHDDYEQSSSNEGKSSSSIKSPSSKNSTNRFSRKNLDLFSREKIDFYSNSYAHAVHANKQDPLATLKIKLNGDSDQIKLVKDKLEIDPICCSGSIKNVKHIRNSDLIIKCDTALNADFIKAELISTYNNQVSISVAKEY